MAGLIEWDMASGCSNHVLRQASAAALTALHCSKNSLMPGYHKDCYPFPAKFKAESKRCMCYLAATLLCTSSSTHCAACFNTLPPMHAAVPLAQLAQAGAAYQHIVPWNVPSQR